MFAAFIMTACAVTSLKLNTEAQNLTSDWKDNVRAGFESRYSNEDLKEFLEEVDKLAAIRDKQQKEEAFQVDKESDEEA